MRLFDFVHHGARRQIWELNPAWRGQGALDPLQIRRITFPGRHVQKRVEMLLRFGHFRPTPQDHLDIRPRFMRRSVMIRRIEPPFVQVESPNEQRVIVDHRHFLMVRDGAQFRQSIATKQNRLTGQAIL